MPSWLKFNATNESFSGIAPANASTLSVAVTAKYTSGLAAHDVFSVEFAAARAMGGISLVGISQAPSVG